MSQETSNFSGIANAGKKVIDASDDIWASASRSFVPKKTAQAVTPYLVGILGFIIHAWELYQAMKDAWTAFKDENMPQRKMRIGVGILSIVFTLMGLAICISLILNTIGFPSLISVFGVTSGFFVFMSTWLLTGVYTLALFRKWYTYTQIEEEDVNDKEEAEREFAFTIFEVIGSAMVGIGILLTTDFFFSDAAVSSFGALPIGFLISGVVLGFVIKFFQYKDEKAGNKYTAAIKETVIEMFGKEDSYDIVIDNDYSFNPLLHPDYFPRPEPVNQGLKDSQDSSNQISNPEPSHSISFFEEPKEYRYQLLEETAKQPASDFDSGEINPRDYDYRTLAGG